MASTPLGWVPHDGDTVHIARGNRWELPAGRYRLRSAPHGRFWLQGMASTETRFTGAAVLTMAESAGTLTAIPRDELEREAEAVRLRLHAPLRQDRHRAFARQHDASDLALFRSANEPGLGL